MSFADNPVSARVLKPNERTAKFVRKHGCLEILATDTLGGKCIWRRWPTCWRRGVTKLERVASGRTRRVNGYRLSVMVKRYCVQEWSDRAFKPSEIPLLVRQVAEFQDKLKSYDLTDLAARLIAADEAEMSGDLQTAKRLRR